MNPRWLIVVGCLALAHQPGLLWAGKVDSAPASSTRPSWADPPTGVFSDEWYVLRMNDRKSGHAHVSMERLKRDGRDLIRATTQMHLEVARGDNTIDVRVLQESEETLDGEPVRFAHELKLGKMPSPRTEGEIRNGKVYVATTQFDRTSEPQVYDLPEGAKMAWATYCEQMRRGLEPGTSYEISSYDPSTSLNRLTPCHIDVLQPETIDLYGRRVQTVKVRQILKIPSLFGKPTEMEMLLWVKPDGNPVRMIMSIIGMPIELLNTSKTVALAPNDPGDLIVNTLIRPDKPIPADCRRAIYRVLLRDDESSKENEELTLPDTQIQKADRKGPREIELTVTLRSVLKRFPSTAPAGHEELTADMRRRYLADSAFINHRDPEVIRLAREAAGDERDPWKIASRLSRFVEEYVQSKNLDVGFATAGEVARSHEGDCSEHGVLLAALARAVGIPSRVVVGMVYADDFLGRTGIFVGHLWTQLWIDGQWIDADGTRGSLDVGPRYIALSVSDAGESTIADLFGSVLLSLGRLDIDVLETD
jgi:hypothetical protein